MLVTDILQAQDNNMWLGGSAGFRNYSDDGDTKSIGGDFSPGFGISINDKLAVGFGLNFSSVTTEEKFASETFETKESEFSVEPFFR